MNYSTLPGFGVACIFESTEKRSREKRGGSEEEEEEAAQAAAGMTDRLGRRVRQDGALLRIRATWTSLWGGDQDQQAPRVCTVSVRDHHVMGRAQGSCSHCLLRLEAGPGSQTGAL